MAKVVGIDLGSNSFRASLYDCNSATIVASYEKTVKTAQGLGKSGVISQAAVTRIIEAIRQMPKEFLDKPIKAVTTQALRSAKNSKVVLQQIFDATGIEFEIIDAKKEAMLTLEAVLHRMQILKIPIQPFVLIDIGGGSTEVVFYDKTQIAFKSFAIGIVTATENGLSALESEFAKMHAFIKDLHPQLMVATAGTATTVAALKKGYSYDTYEAKFINGTVVDTKDLDATLQKLQTLDSHCLEKLVGILRGDLIITGIAIYQKIFELFNMQSSLVIDDGLREGIVLRYCQKLGTTY